MVHLKLNLRNMGKVQKVLRRAGTSLCLLHRHALTCLKLPMRNRASRDSGLVPRAGLPRKLNLSEDLRYPA